MRDPLEKAAHRLDDVGPDLGLAHHHVGNQLVQETLLQLISFGVAIGVEPSAEQRRQNQATHSTLQTILHVLREILSKKWVHLIKL